MTNLKATRSLTLSIAVSNSTKLSRSHRSAGMCSARVPPENCSYSRRQTEVRKEMNLYVEMEKRVVFSYLQKIRQIVEGARRAVWTTAALFWWLKTGKISFSPHVNDANPKKTKQQSPLINTVQRESMNATFTTPSSVWVTWSGFTEVSSGVKPRVQHHVLRLSHYRHQDS